MGRQSWLRVVARYTPRARRPTPACVQRCIGRCRLGDVLVVLVLTEVVVLAFLLSVLAFPFRHTVSQAIGHSTAAVLWGSFLRWTYKSLYRKPFIPSPFTVERLTHVCWRHVRVRGMGMGMGCRSRVVVLRVSPLTVLLWRAVPSADAHPMRRGAANRNFKARRGYRCTCCPKDWVRM